MGAVEKSDRSGTREFRGENTHGRETLCFFSKVASGVAAVGSLFPLGPRSWTQGHRTVVALQKAKKMKRLEHFGKMRSAKYAPDGSERSIWCCANVGRFGAALLLCGFATGCNKLAPLHTRKHQ